MADYKLYQGDCIDIMKDIPDKSVDLIITDPPYEVSVTNSGGTVNDIKNFNATLKGIDDAGINKGYDIELVGTEFIRVLKDIHLFVWCNKGQIWDYFQFYVGQHGCKYDIICWHKPNALPTYSNKYLTDTEYCLHFFKSTGKGARTHPENYEDAKTYLFAPINHTDKKLYEHPTIKPLNLTESMVRNCSDKGDTILDPFMGSGTTGVACINNSRNFIGIEINDSFYRIAEQRISEAKENNKDNREDFNI